MAYDPCLPKLMPRPTAVAGKPARVGQHHPHGHLHRLLGRRKAVAPAPRPARDACPKARHPLAPPRRLVVAVAGLAAPPVLTTVGIGVVGASAFHGAATFPGVIDPVHVTPVVVPAQPGAPVAGGGAPGTGTNVPEPGSAALLAVAMIVVVVSSWIHGGRAFRKPPESDVAAPPLRRDRRKFRLSVSRQG